MSGPSNKIFGNAEFIFYIKTLRFQHTGISITLTKALVFRSPIVKLLSINAKKRHIKTATDAGKDIELSAIRELTPKQARSMIRIPTGTYNHETRFLFHDKRPT